MKELHVAEQKLEENGLAKSQKKRKDEQEYAE